MSGGHREAFMGLLLCVPEALKEARTYQLYCQDKATSSSRA